MSTACGQLDGLVRRPLVGNWMDGLEYDAWKRGSWVILYGGFDI